jgi:hypothetical protein
MKRTFNYTERVKINQRSVTVRLYTDTAGIQVFDADIDLSQHKSLPAGTQIYLEAYYRSALMRFDVGVYDPAQSRYELRGIPLDELQDPIVYFRVKLVDKSARVGRLVGGVERVQAFNEDAKQVQRIGLLPVNFGVDLGHRIWEVQFPDDGTDPMLCVNSNLNADDGLLRNFVAQESAFVSLVFPEALRRILERLLEEGYDSSDEESWQYKWVRFAFSLGVGLPSDSDDDLKRQWIDEAVDAFCVQAKIKTLFEDLLGEMSR